ncbi:MAG: molybdopterin molybdotransferase MoeA [Sporomusaceae bacterium]|nr:molybdopterin molybdotransferase MoeA [Sporomusaceae bacterium]
MELETARDLLTPLLPKNPTVRIPLADSFGRLLAEPIIAALDFPPFDRSPLDGYAVRSADIQGASAAAPKTLIQTDNIPAGTFSTKPVCPGEAARIMTGAPLPPGADGVVRLEDTNLVDDIVTIYTDQQAAKNICRRGEEIHSGETLLTPGTYINEGVLGLLALVGQTQPLVYTKPRIGLLATGSELVPPEAPLTPGKIRDTNSFMLAGKILKCGGEPHLLGLVPDRLEAIIESLETAPPLPIYLTTGGASVGDYDLMEQLFQHFKIPILFNRLDIKPGMPVIAGLWKNSLLIALSGNPAASSVSFEVLLRPLIQKLAGFSCWEHQRSLVTLNSEFTKPSPTRRFVWARCYNHNGRMYADPLSSQGNGMLKAAASANALLDIPPNTPALTPGMQFEALLL